MTTRELALLCSYARSALLTSGKFCTRESVFHSSPSLCAPAPYAAVADESRRRSSASSSRKSSSISDGDGSEGEDVADNFLFNTDHLLPLPIYDQTQANAIAAQPGYLEMTTH